MHSVEAQAVDVVVAHPLQSVVQHESPHFVAFRSVEVEARPPVGLMAIREVRAELREKVAHRAEVVVNHVHHDAQPGQMARIDQPLQARRTTVGVMGREEIDPVVAPSAIAGKLRHRHELDSVDAKREEVG